MLEPPDSVTRPPTGNQGHPTPEAPPAVGRGTVGEAGVVPAGAHRHALVEAARVSERDGARPVIERDAATGCKGDGAARRDRDGAEREREGATGRERDEALGREHDGAGRLVESHSRPSWSHDWLQLSHELRTPLNAILGNIELLLDGSAGPLAAPARACIGDIQTASRQLLHQLQPLLLLVQARTSGALATRMPLDLLALIRQASADTRPDQDASRRPDVHLACLPERPPGAACLPEPASLMVPGDPVWLGALAAALVDLHATSQDAKGPLSITLEPPEPGAGGVVLRATWAGLDPATTSPVPLALIDAVLALHGGRIRAFGGDGLRLDLPGAVSATDGAGAPLSVTDRQGGRDRRRISWGGMEDDRQGVVVCAGHPYCPIERSR